MMIMMIKKNMMKTMQKFFYLLTEDLPPGQIVYFKGIGVTKDWKTKKSILLQSKDSINIIFI